MRQAKGPSPAGRHAETRTFMRFKAALAATLLACIAATVTCLAIPSAPALAESCPSEQSLLPSSGDPPFTCAQMNYSGKKKIPPADTKTWSKSVATEPTYYDIQTHCEHPNDSDVTVSWAGAVSSYSATGHNWGTGDHSFGAGVLFTLHDGKTVDKSSFKGGCSNDKAAKKEGRITNSIVKRGKSLTFTPGTYENATVGVQQTIPAEISPSDAVGTVLLYIDTKDPNPQTDTAIGKGQIFSLADGKFSITWTPQPGQEGDHTLTALYIGDTSFCPSDNATCGWGPVKSKAYDTTIKPASGSAASATMASGPLALRAPFAAPTSDASADRGALPNPHLTTRTKAAKMPAPLALRCPRGSVLMYAETLSPGKAPLAYSRRGVRVRSGELRRGRRVNIQITCRSHSAQLLIHKRLGLGTPGPDVIDAGARGARLVFGGPGKDRIRVRAPNAVAYGGLGADRIAVAARNDVAAGGPGDDWLIARTPKRTLLVGGPRHDTLIGSRGRTLINAKDGARDRVVCRSERNRVLADRRDAVRGPCRTIRRP